ncbi:lysine-specific demethylase 8 [Caerostris extrusa]|uniref:JmjC domain-containing protein 5 n=1 Tax=Caerostris extrusa TaxID=172846 RepID=A0AAV4TLJ5_CAEEX|nr:lysine-specific demethylase 8 [Caerostris extrusa]
MTTNKDFRFDLFESSIAAVLHDCSYINLPFELSGINEDVNELLTSCGNIFFQENISKTDLLQCITHSKIVLDITWEKMNTGHWKDVDANWRYAYTLASLFKVLCLLATKDSTKIDIIKACDMGLLMGAPLMKNILKGLLLKYEVKEEKNLPQEEFLENYLRKSCPVILNDSIKNWPAFSSKPWSVDYILEKARYRTVPIEIGSKYTDDNWTQTLMTVEEFVEKYIKHKSQQKEIGYLAQHSLFDQIPELFEDIELPSYIANKNDVDISVYFGPGGTISPLHFDPKFNLLAQVIGEKYIRLYAEDQTKYLYPRHNTWLSNTSQVDLDNPDFNSFPLFSQATYQECVLKPGQLLYIPPKCWHYVLSLSNSLSISFLVVK